MTSTANRLARKQDREQGIGTNESPVKFSQQDYDDLRQQCLKSNRLFEDNTFPAERKTLGYKELGPYSPNTKGVVWKRPNELCSDPQFILDGATRTDICQGALGDCWLLAAIASLTMDQQILDRVVPPGQSFTENYAGIFHFKFWQFGNWTDVVIDDRLPTKDGKLLFVHSAEGSEFWSPLLEKAYAKLNGSYEALIGGSTIEGFEDFTGGIAETFMLNKAPSNLFYIIQKALSLGSLLGCSVDITNARDSEAITSLKLVKGHAYSLTGAEEVNYRGSREQLVRLRNPWGQVEWTGPWSDGSREWNYINEDEKSNLNSVAEDGEFWMSFSDFTKNFSKLEICNLTPDSITSESTSCWSHSQFEGMWRTGSTAGGCRNNRATFPSNPQFMIRLEDVDDNPLDGEDGCTFLVGLMQKDSRQQKKLNRDHESIGFVIYKYKGRNNVRLGPDVLLRQNHVALSSFTNTREVCERFTLPPGEYVIIPSSFEPHKNGNFVLRVFSEKQANEPSEKDVDPHFKEIFRRIAGDVGGGTVNEIYISYNNLYISTRTWRFVHINFNVLQKDETCTLGLTEFYVCWKKMERYLEIFKLIDTDHSGTMSTHEMRDAAAAAGFNINSALLQAIVNRYADAHYAIDFDGFVSCLVKLEMHYKMFKALEKGDSGKIELDMQQVCERITNPAGLSAFLV
uniref:Calpain 8 n=1 Tax=Monopterus albus TaxID=43700 RepID=A0A3Q3Q5C1_MONAL